jgi:hypothetical protein
VALQGIRTTGPRGEDPVDVIESSWKKGSFDCGSSLRARKDESSLRMTKD